MKGLVRLGTRTELHERALPGDEARLAAGELSEQELIERARSHPAAFGRLYEANYARVLNYIYRRMLSIDVAEELTSNTFFKALRALPKYRHRAPFRFWLYRIASNEVKMYFRSKARRRASHTDPQWPAELKQVHFATSKMEKDEDREAKMRQFSRLHQCIALLPERYQTVLALRYFEGLPYDDISRVLGKNVGTVRSLAHRGLKRLKRLLGEEGATFH